MASSDGLWRGYRKRIVSSAYQHVISIEINYNAIDMTYSFSTSNDIAVIARKI
ncbi:MAG: hypothetical protein ACI3Y5_00045 [Prevotella sp.]